MAAIVSVVATDNWNSNGSWVGGIQPTAADDVTLAAGSNLTIPTATTVQCRSLTIAATATLAGSTGTAILNIGDATAGAGNVALSNSGSISNTNGWGMNFISTSATVQTVKTGGSTMPVVNFNGAGSSYQLTDSFTTVNTLQHTLGTLDTNSQTMSVLAFFGSFASGTRSLILGGSQITCTVNSSTGWNFALVGGLTFNAGTSTITCSGFTVAFSGGGLTYNNVVFTGGATTNITGANTYANLTETGTATKTVNLNISSNQTVTGTLTLTANSLVNAILVSSGAVGTPVTITAATVVATNTVNFRDITGAGAATWTTTATGATYFGDCGGNSGITMTPAITLTSTGVSSFTWSTHNWSTPTGFGRVPLPQDTVIVNNAFKVGQTITMDMTRMGGSTDFSGCTGRPSLSMVAFEIYGSLNTSNVIITSMSGSSVMRGRGNYTLTPGGNGYGTFSISAPGGVHTLVGSYSSTLSLFTASLGVFNTNNNNMSVDSFSTGASGTTRSIILGTSTITLNSVGTTNVFANPVSQVGLTFSGASATFNIVNSSLNTRTFQQGNLTIGTISYAVPGSGGAFVITNGGQINTLNYTGSGGSSLTVPASTNITNLSIGSYNTSAPEIIFQGDETITNFNATGYLNIYFTNGKTITSSIFNANGTVSGAIVMRSTVDNYQWKLNVSTGYSVSNVDLKDSNASGSAILP